ncbi:hypothetical protein Acor_54320 [Acrocarpospora corrugata]|uniref:PepSY domain-containing protein n=1 Tax=Acrocarpospora corrugata TaxID=35763 RepID=A0A5M3W3P3_9ACTN|nr:PepSY domain-containing protein [Acrocarpospora corrugata]GES03366.1 hypothetical protein Acor_54320 [Acrocarpospora corrugata]
MVPIPGGFGWSSAAGRAGSGSGQPVSIAPIRRRTHVSCVDEQPAGGDPPPPATDPAQVSAARAAHPAGDVTSVMPAIDETSTTRVVFSDSTVPADYAMAVFADPYTAEIRGQVQTFGQWLGVRAWIDDLHRNLHLGAFDRNYSELAASWMWIVVLGGISLWLGRRRADRRLRRVFLPDTSKRGAPVTCRGTPRPVSGSRSACSCCPPRV